MIKDEDEDGYKGGVFKFLVAFGKKVYSKFSKMIILKMKRLSIRIIKNLT